MWTTLNESITFGETPNSSHKIVCSGADKETKEKAQIFINNVGGVLIHIVIITISGGPSGNQL